MGTRIPSHQLSNGLYVSGLPDQHKERQPTMASRAVPYTGGDIKKSGELGKMFDIPVVDPSKSRPCSSSAHNSGSIARSASNSGPLLKPSNSGPLSKRNSGPLPLHPTGLITSGPLGSSSAGGLRRSGQLETTASMSKPYGAAVTSLGEEVGFGYKIHKPAMWVLLFVFATCLVAGVFMMVTVKKPVILGVSGVLLVVVLVCVVWNHKCWRRGLKRFLRNYPDAELRGAKNGQYVKVTGVVTCGSIPLESSFQRVPRCVYVSTGLHEYRGWSGKPANSNHCRFSWGLRHLERHVADFYISDFQSGLRALVKAGYGAKVASFVKPVTVFDINKENREPSPNFLRWLTERNLSSDDRMMRLEEGYIKEGSTISVMGVVQRHDNMLMITPTADPFSTGCHWLSCFLRAHIEGLALMCDESQSADVIPV